MDFDSPVATATAGQTQALGRKFGNTLLHSLKKGRAGHAIVVCLYGELGSGKTTFVKGMAQRFGISSRLLSPTFIIVRRYALAKISTLFYHVDLYRAENKQIIQSIGLAEILADPCAVVVIEWAERAARIFPRSRYGITFKYTTHGRTITIRKYF